MKRVALLAALVALMPVAPVMAAEGGIDVGDYVKKDEFTDVKLSPGGEYYAATVPLADRTALAVIERGTNKITGSFKLGRNAHVADFDWISRDRLLISLSDRFGELEQPLMTGELIAMNADGSKTEMLAGFRVDDGGLGTTIKPKKGSDSIGAFPIAAPFKESRSALVQVVPFSADPYPAIESIDVFTGRRARVAVSPVRRATFFTDNRGEVRFVAGSESDNVRKLYYRSGEGDGWTMFGMEDSKGRFEYPIGFSADDKVVYLIAEQAKGPDKIVALDLASRERKVVLGDDNVDPEQIIYRNGTRIPLGAFFMDGKPRTAFFDETVPEAKLYHSLESAFAGSSVEITSQTSDGSLALIRVSSDL